MKVKNPSFTLMIDIFLNLIYSPSSRVRLFFSPSLFCRDNVEVVRGVRVSVRVLKKPGGGENMHSVFEGFFCAYVHFKDKSSKVVGKEGDPFFDVGPVFKNNVLSST